jgi:hypothetical protein
MSLRERDDPVELGRAPERREIRSRLAVVQRNRGRRAHIRRRIAAQDPIEGRRRVAHSQQIAQRSPRTGIVQSAKTVNDQLRGRRVAGKLRRTQGGLNRTCDSERFARRIGPSQRIQQSAQGGCVTALAERREQRIIVVRFRGGEKPRQQGLDACLAGAIGFSRQVSAACVQQDGECERNTPRQD